MYSIAVLVLLGLSASCLGTGVDLTIQDRAVGPAVVKAVLERIRAACVFPDDKLFLRRLAYVESQDGGLHSTFRTGYSGGIWQVDETYFLATQDAANDNYLKAAKDEILAQFGIDWSTVVWANLTTPLHSALGAGLYLTYQAQSGNVTEVPRSVEDQATFYVTHYRTTSLTSIFEASVKQLEVGCQISKYPDLAFVLDSSGSVGAKNFVEVLDFVEKVVLEFDISPTKTRVAILRFNAAVTTEFNFNTYTTRTQVLVAIKNIKYTMGGTRTDLALDELVSSVFTVTNGARALQERHPRVAVVLTDGKSNEPDKTKVSAAKVHSADIDVIAIGVTSGVNMEELEIIASTPTCTHLFVLNDFAEVPALSSAIAQQTCDAPVIITPSENCTSGIRIGVDTDFSFNCRIRLSAGGATVRMTTDNSDANLYLAAGTQASAAYYTSAVSAVKGIPDALFIPGTNREISCRFELNTNIRVEIRICVAPGDRDACRSDPCQNGGTCVDEGRGDYSCICPPGYVGDNCETNYCEPDNPCLNGGTCTPQATNYTCSCPKEYVGSNCKEPAWYDCTNPKRNPCVLYDVVGMNDFYWPAQNETNFVQCDASGGCWIMPCAPGTVYDDDINTCSWP